MRMFGKIVYSVGATSVTVVSGLLRNKILAVFLSLNLFGILSIGQQSVSLLFTIFAFGLPLGITTLSSQLLTRPREEQIEVVSRLTVLALLLAGIVVLVLLSASVISPTFLSRAVTGNEEYAFPLVILLLSTPFMLVEYSLYAVMEGMGMAKEIILFKVIPSILVLPVLYILSTRYQLVGGAAGLLFNEMLLAGLGLYLLRRLLKFDLAALNVRPIIAKVFKVASLSFLVGAGWFAADFLVKRYMLETLGQVSNGIVQSVAKIADLYPSVALSWLSMHLFPAIAISLDNRAITTGAIHRTVRIAVVLIAPVILVLFAFRSQVLELVYKKEFTLAVDYFGAMLSVGILKVFSWVIGLALLPMGLKKEWFYSAVVLIVGYVLGVIVGLSGEVGIYAIPLGLGLGLSLQTAYTLKVYGVKGYVFERGFRADLIMCSLMTVLLASSVFWLPVLAIAIVSYLWYIYHFQILHELKVRLNEVRSKISA